MDRHGRLCLQRWTSVPRCSATARGPQPWRRATCQQPDHPVSGQRNISRSPHMTVPSDGAEVLVVGAGPAGVAAAVMAASLGLQTVVVEAGRVGGKLHAIGAL